MRFSILLAAVGILFLHASSARSQTDAGAAWDELNQSATAVENATPGDCETACKALESMERAAQHICSMAPEHCDEAKARVAAARERVKSACPTCMSAPQEFASDKAAGNTVAVAESRPPSGCGGCATIESAASSRGAFLAIAMLLLVARIRRRHRR